MPPEYVPLVTLIVGLVFQPVKDGIAAIRNDRKTEARRRWQFDFDNVQALRGSLEVLGSAGIYTKAGAIDEAWGRFIATLPFIRDDRLRELGTQLEERRRQTNEWHAAYLVVAERMGEVARSM